MSDSDDDEPIFIQREAKDTHNYILNEKQEKQPICSNIWSVDFAAFCGYLAWYAENQGTRASRAPKDVWLMKEKDTAVFSLAHSVLEATVIRRASPYLKRLLVAKKLHGSCPQDILPESVGIRFTVRAMSGRNYYLMYHPDAGVLMVKVESIEKPVEDKDGVTAILNEDEKWKKTMTFRRVFDTQDAVMKAKGQKDNGKYLGEEALRKLWKEEVRTERMTYHEGDCTYEGDIRTLVGVVRWHRANTVTSELPKDYFAEYADADLVLTGDSVCQNTKM